MGRCHFFMDQVAPPENSDRGAGIMEYGPQKNYLMGT
jgi:hypothetical protein